MIDPKRFALSPRHVSVSTVGVVKNMYRLTEELPQVRDGDRGEPDDTAALYISRHHANCTIN